MEAFFANKSSLLLAGAVVVMVLVLLRMWRRTLAASASEKSPRVRFARPAPTIENTEPVLKNIPPEMSRWEAEMHETARELKAELDTKMAVLQRLILDARRESERLEAAIERSEAAEKKQA